MPEVNKSSLGRLLIILFWFLLLFVLADLIFIFLLPFANPESLTEKIPPKNPSHYVPAQVKDTAYWRAIVDQGPAPITRTVTVTTTASGATIDLGLVITRTHPLVQIITNGIAGQNLPSLVQAVFGTVTLNQVTLDEQDLTYLSWKVEPNDGEVQLDILAFRPLNGYASFSVDRPDQDTNSTPGHDQVNLINNGLQIYQFYPMPDQTTADGVILTRKSPYQIDHLYFLVQPVTSAATDTASSNARGPTRQDYLQQLDNLLAAPGLTSLFFSIIKALPILIFIYYARKQRSRTLLRDGLVNSSIILLIFHFMLYFVLGTAGAIRGTWLDNILSDWMSRTMSNLYLPHIRPFLGNGSLLAGALVVSSLVPAAMIQRSGYALEKIKIRPIIWIPFSILLMVFLAGWVIAVKNLVTLINGMINGTVEILPLWEFALSAAVLLLPGVYLCGAMLYKQLTGKRLPAWMLFLFTISVAGVIMLFTYAGISDQINLWYPIAWLVLCAFLGSIIIFAFLVVIYFQAKQLSIPLRLTPRSWLVIAILCILLAIPINLQLAGSRQSASYNDLISLAIDLDGLILFLWAAGLFWLLYRRGRERTPISSLARLIGILATAPLLFNVAANWMNIPITFLIGLVLLNYFIRPAETWLKVKPYFGKVMQNRADLLDKIINLNAAETKYKSYRKELAGELAEGKLTSEDYDRQLAERRKQLDNLQVLATLETQPVPALASPSIKDIALEFGPLPTAWANGVHGTKWAILFALPWMALYTAEFLSKPQPIHGYVLWDYLQAFLAVFGKWAVMGFIFGYFYPYLRGKDGLQKGLGLFLIAVLPTLPLATINNNTIATWQATLFWTLQVFIECMLLGMVAFDYMTLRQGKLDWQMLFEVHGITQVGISISTILAAAGAAIITLLTTQTTNLIGLALNFIIPQIPTNLLPK
jgi:hypothetical protein